MSKTIVILLCLLLTSCTQSFNHWLSSQEIYRSLRDEGKVGLYINFKVNSSALSGKSIRQIGEIDKALKKLDISNHNILIIGHTDTQGNKDVNKVLSLDRAATVVNALIDDYGFPPGNLRWEGKGETEPLIYPERTTHDRWMNRRVEVVLVKKQGAP